MLALAVLGCDLKLLGCDWLSTILSLQTFAQAKGGELSICYESVVPHYAQIASQYPLFIGIRRSAETPGTDDVMQVDRETREMIPEPACASNEQSSATLESGTPSPMATNVEPSLAAKCSNNAVASVCSSPVKAAA